MSDVKPASLVQVRPGEWHLYVPWVNPPTKNEWERMFWGARGALKDTIFAYMLVAKVTCRHYRKLVWPVEIQPVVLKGPRRGRPADPGNYQVTINECMIDRLCDPVAFMKKGGGFGQKKGIGMIPDDGPKYVKENSPIVEHGSNVIGVELVIWEKGENPNESLQHRDLQVGRQLVQGHGAGQEDQGRETEA